MQTVEDLQLARLLTSAFANDPYFHHYFHPSPLGTATRFMLFFDDVRLRRRTGIVMTEPDAVALLGLPPKPYLEKDDLNWITRAMIVLQGQPYRARWQALWMTTDRSGSNVVTRCPAYLSALACAPHVQGRGVGTRLLARVCAEVERRRLAVECEVSSTHLRKWYEARGFSYVRENDWSPSFTTFDMIKRLPASP